MIELSSLDFIIKLALFGFVVPNLSILKMWTYEFLVFSQSFPFFADNFGYVCELHALRYKFCLAYLDSQFLKMVFCGWCRAKTP